MLGIAEFGMCDLWNLVWSAITGRLFSVLLVYLSPVYVGSLPAFQVLSFVSYPIIGKKLTKKVKSKGLCVFFYLLISYFQF